MDSQYCGHITEIFFNNTFKSNPQLHKGIITGITRNSMSREASHQESIFSDLNNLDVVTMTSDKYATAFGFTEAEVFQALDDAGFGKEKRHVKEYIIMRNSPQIPNLL